MRGGGGNFGVVTSFAFRSHPIPEMMFFTIPLYPVAQAETVIRAWRDMVATVPDAFSSNILILTIPDLPLSPEAIRGQAVVGISGLYCGDVAVGEVYARPLRELGEPLLDLSGPRPYLTMQSANDYLFPPHIHQHYHKSIDMPELADATIVEIAGRAAERQSPRSIVEIWHHGGAIARITPEASAFWRRRVPFMVSFAATWIEPADTERCVAWARAGWDALRTASDGSVYVNFPGAADEGATLLRGAYGGNYDRLVAVKRRYDPGNLFRMNLNIPPES